MRGRWGLVGGERVVEEAEGDFERGSVVEVVVAEVVGARGGGTVVRGGKGGKG